MSKRKKSLAELLKPRCPLCEKDSSMGLVCKDCIAEGLRLAIEQSKSMSLEEREALNQEFQEWRDQEELKR